MGLFELILRVGCTGRPDRAGELGVVQRGQRLEEFHYLSEPPPCPPLMTRLTTARAAPQRIVELPAVLLSLPQPREK
jgi:hypothetical protein